MAKPPRTPQADHERYMRLALAQAEQARGRTHPNPIVGSVVVRQGKVVGRGHHRKAGEAHGEVEALLDAGGRARGADLYVTLEPCNHQGRTPPCTDAILAAGVRRVFVGSIDPNPLVSGRGIARLLREGLTVEVGVLRAACDAALEGWFKFITQKQPWVVLKAAATLDGMLATRTGDSRWISSPKAREAVHRWRDQLDAVLIGSGTALADDPALTARLPGARDPLRVVLDGLARLPLRSQLLQAQPERTWVATGPAAPAARLRALEKAGAKVLRCRAGKGGRLSLPHLLTQLATLGITSLLVEGGAQVHGAFLAEGLWDELRLFVAPKLLGQGGLSWAGFPGPRSMEGVLPLDVRQVAQIGPDLLVLARPVR